jgi:serine phosphatase RsbU (regulator of sigma subunit)
VIFTDGIPEIEVKDGKQLGLRRFSKIFQNTREMPLSRAAAAILEEADGIRGNAAQEDDWTLVLLERRSDGSLEQHTAKG